MNSRPAGYSSDEDDEFNDFSFHGDIKTEKEKRQEANIELYNTQQEIENSAVNKLYSAIVGGNLNQTIKILDENDLDIHCNLTADWTPIFLAVSLGSDLIVEELLKRGADALADRDGFTTLMAACNCSNSSTTSNKIASIVQQLLNKSVNCKTIDRKRRTAFMLSCEQGFLDVIALLLPLSDVHAEDNQGWTALFYAVNANMPLVVKLLLENGANLMHNDVRSNNVKYYATLNDFQDVLKIFPQEEEEIGPDDLVITELNFENMFDELGNFDRPDFTPDLTFILYGMNCQKLIPIFNKNKVNLKSFLTLTEQKLQELGVAMSFQRNRIHQGIFRFHQRTWKKNSISIVPRHETYTTFDLFSTAVTAVKHILVMESSIIYIKQNLDKDLLLNCDQNTKNLIVFKMSMIHKKIIALKSIVKLLHKKALQFDNSVSGPADLITKDVRFKKNGLKRKLIISFASISAIFVVKYCLYKFL